MFTGLRVSNFRERFCELFNESGKTNTDLGKALNVSNQTISAWRLGTRSPKAPTVMAVADYFGVSVKWLLGFDVEKTVPSTQRSVIIQNSEMFTNVLNHMSNEDFSMVVEAFYRTYKKMKESEGQCQEEEDRT